MVRAVVCITALLASIAMSAVATAQDTGSPQSVFAEANRLYEAGDYDGAVRGYTVLAERGAVDKDLFYNLGNAHYKAGSIGLAVLYYERALRLAPRDEDVRANLTLVRSLLRDRQFVETASWLRRVVTWVPGHSSTREVWLVASMLFFLLVGLAIAFVFRDTRAVSRLYASVSIASPGRLLGIEKAQDFGLAIAMMVVLFVLTATAAGVKHRDDTARPSAVVLEEEVSVYGGPSRDAIMQFKIHEGTVVRVSDTRPGWAEVDLPGDLSGWIPAGALARI